MKILEKTLLLSCIVLLGIALTGCSVKNTGVPGNTLIDKDYANNLLPMLSMYVAIEAVPDCKNVEIVSTEITKQPEGKGEKKWEELWTLNACGKTVEVPLNMTDKEQRIQTFITSDKMKVK